MKACTRGSEPECLRENGRLWSERWQAKCEESSKAPNWFWPKWHNTPVNHLVCEALGAMTQKHCAYCDGYPLDSTGRETIDHFRPKCRGESPELAFAWENLFLACERCQGEKRDCFDPALLRPDEPGYEFSHYFVFNYLTGDLEVNPAAPAEHQVRANVTIDLLGLNRGGRPRARKRELDLFVRLSDRGGQDAVDDWSYRFLFEADGA